MSAEELCKKIIDTIKSIPETRLDDVISEMIQQSGIRTEGKIREFYKAIHSIYED